MSMDSIRLNEEQQALYDELKASLEHYAQVGRDISSQENFGALLKRMAQKANQLHLSLKASGHEPRHHKYMYENRGVPAEDVEFYNHIHPIEDLLKFVEDPHANDDPVDRTIGEEFELKVFSRRWGHPDTYRLKRTANGWLIRFVAISGTCDKSGYPVLFSNLQHDSIDYPKNLGHWLEWLWEQAKESGLSRDEVQKALDELSEWLIGIERTAPKGAVWQGYKA